MDLMEISSCVGAITTVGVFVVGIYKVMKVVSAMEEKLDDIPIIKQELNTLKEDIKEVKDELEDNSIETCRLVITNEQMPLEERIKAGQKYVEKYHANGGVKLLYEELKTTQAQEEYQRMRVPKIHSYDS